LLPWLALLPRLAVRPVLALPPVLAEPPVLLSKPGMAAPPTGVPLAGVVDWDARPVWLPAAPAPADAGEGEAAEGALAEGAEAAAGEVAAGDVCAAGGCVARVDRIGSTHRKQNQWRGEYANRHEISLKLPLGDSFIATKAQRCQARA